MTRSRERVNPTARDVARLARVSTATVSRALSQPDVVRPKTRERIERAVASLNYVSHGVARALSTRRTRTVGAVIPTLDNAIYAASTHSLQKSLEQAGYTLLLACHDFDLAAEARMVRTFAERGVDGLVLVGTLHDASTRRLLPTLGIPWVLTWALERGQRTASVGFDNYAAGSMVAEHLLQLGHRHIGVISGIVKDNDRARDRLKGISAALARAGIALARENVVAAPYSLSAGRDALAELARRGRFTAVACGNDILAIGAIQEAQSMGLNVPGDISITGFDDMELASVVTPALTTVHFPIAEVGLEAARLLVDLLDNRSAPRRIELPMKLVVRKSTGAPRAGRRPGLLDTG